MNTGQGSQNKNQLLMYEGYSREDLLQEVLRLRLQNQNLRAEVDFQMDRANENSRAAAHNYRRKHVCTRED